MLIATVHARSVPSVGEKLARFCEMPRATRSGKLDSRHARGKLLARSAPYFVKLQQGLQLGYAKGAKGGSWIGRRYIGEKRYQKERLGLADDLADADGVSTLDFWQAQKAAKTWAAREVLADKGLAKRGPHTVGDAIFEYLVHLSSTKGPKAEADARSNANAHIMEPLGTILVDELSTSKITKWHRQLAEGPKLVRSKNGAKTRATFPTPNEADSHRKRRARANRILTVLKAALNHAFNSGRVASDVAWRRTKPFANVDTPVVRHLSHDEIRRLLDGCDPAFRTLVHAALLTGCRYGELTGLRVSDINLEVGTVAIRMSKSGKPRHVVLTEEGVALLRKLKTGKQPSDGLFVRADGRPWAASHQQRPLQAASRQAGITPPVSFHILRHTHASLLAMQGVLMGVIAAQLGHADTRMTEKHYAHLAPSYVADTIRANFPALDPTSEVAAHH